MPSGLDSTLSPLLVFSGGVRPGLGFRPLAHTTRRLGALSVLPIPGAAIFAARMSLRGEAICAAQVCDPRGGIQQTRSKATAEFSSALHLQSPAPHPN